MTPDIRLIALDMDGTLLDADHSTIPPRNLNALRAAAAKGVHIAIATGRSWSLVQETAQTLGCVSYGITANGALALDTVGETPLVKFPMDPRQCVEIIRTLRRHGLYYELYVDGRNYMQADELEGAREFCLSDAFYEMFRRHVILQPDMELFAAETQPEKFDIFYVDADKRAAVVNELLSTGPLEVTGALQTNLELTARGVNKGRALAALADKLGLDASQVMAFGDADNDLEMLAWAGWSFAMENGTDQAKAAAKFITERNSEGGVGIAVEKYCVFH
jgi:hypothetical protein